MSEVASMELRDQIIRIQSDLRAGRFPNEAAVKQGIVLPILRALGWPDHDPEIVWPECTVEGGRADYALCHPRKKPAAFVEVKQVGQGEGAESQLFQYAYHAGVPLVVLTNGQEWRFYFPPGQGPYHERRVYKLDLVERPIDESVERLTRYLAYQRVCSGEAVESAQADYRRAAQAREAEAALPAAWQKLVVQQDSRLIEAIADEVEAQTGYRPEPDVVAAFLETRLQSVSALTDARSARHRQPVVAAPSKRPPPRRRGSIRVVLGGRQFHVGSAVEALVTVLNELSARDQFFSERFAGLPKHGRSRRYMAQAKDQLYPGRPDLCERFSYQLHSGWWVGTNYSRKEIKHILEMACEVAGVQFDCDI